MFKEILHSEEASRDGTSDFATLRVFRSLFSSFRFHKYQCCNFKVNGGAFVADLNVRIEWST